MIVDANIATYWFADTPLSSRARPLLGRDDLVAPKMIRLEVARSLLKYLRVGLISQDQVREAATRVGEYFSELVDDDTLLRQAVELSIAYNHIVSDCLYLALALARGEQFATADRRLALLARKLEIETNLIGTQ